MDIPVLFEHKEDCCGCTACFCACPRQAISMKADDEGFLYPHIDEGLCICCRLCISVCPLK
ncbi:MAG: (Fe-S)-binding protein [Eubacteriales bacterium]|nr:(Fe-S)-binding protein [Eubacteriales bacterium]